jgi:MFS family permease
MKAPTLFYMAAGCAAVALLTLRWHVISGLAWIVGGLLLWVSVPAGLSATIPDRFGRRMMLGALVVAGGVFIVLGFFTFIG